MLYDSLHGKLLDAARRGRRLSGARRRDRCAAGTSRARLQLDDRRSSAGSTTRCKPMPREEFVRLDDGGPAGGARRISPGTRRSTARAPRSSTSCRAPKGFAPEAIEARRRRRERSCSTSARPRRLRRRATCRRLAPASASNGQFASWAGALVAPETPLIARHRRRGARRRGAHAAGARGPRERRGISGGRSSRVGRGRPPAGAHRADHGR